MINSPIHVILVFPTFRQNTSAKMQKAEFLDIENLISKKINRSTILYAKNRRQAVKFITVISASETRSFMKWLNHYWFDYSSENQKLIWWIFIWVWTYSTEPRISRLQCWMTTSFCSWCTAHSMWANDMNKFHSIIRPSQNVWPLLRPMA